jgi:hypothetical protein
VVNAEMFCGATKASKSTSKLSSEHPKKSAKQEDLLLILNFHNYCFFNILGFVPISVSKLNFLNWGNIHSSQL